MSAIWVYPYKDDELDAELFPHLAIDTRTGVIKHRKYDQRTKQYRPITLGTKDLAEARVKYLEIDKAPVVEGSRKMTVALAYDAWVERLKIRGRKPSTLRRYQCCWENDIRDEIGHMLVKDVTPRVVLDVEDKAKKRKKRHGLVNAKGEATGRKTVKIDPKTGKPEKLGESSIYQVHATMSSLFRFCAEPTNGWIPSNPCRDLGDDKPRLPKPGEVAEEKTYSDEDIDRMAAAMPEANWTQYQRKVIVQLSPTVGTRINELLGCVLEDVTLPPVLAVAGKQRSGRLRLERQLMFRTERNADDPRTWFDDLKGANTRIGDKKRTVPIGSYAADVLRKYIARGEAEGRLRPGHLLFPNSKGRPLDFSRLSKALREVGIETGMTVRSHYFRHTYISTLISNGAAIDTAAAFAGHDPKMTKDRYGHFQPSDEFYDEVADLTRQVAQG